MLNGLKLYDYPMFNKNINSVPTIQFNLLVNDGYRFLALMSDAAQGEFFAEALFVGRFEQAWAKEAMDFDGCAYDSASKVSVGLGFMKKKITTELAEESRVSGDAEAWLAASAGLRTRRFAEEVKS